VKFVVASREDWDYALNVIGRFDLERAAKAVLISPAWGEIELKDLANGWPKRIEPANATAAT
jgi:7-carboxy-7-deazaguanine synthase